MFEFFFFWFEYNLHSRFSFFLNLRCYRLSGWRSGNLAGSNTRLAAEAGKVFVLVAVLGPNNEFAVSEAGLVDALDGCLTLQHRQVHHGLVLHVLVVRTADVSAAVYWRCVFDNKELLVFYVDSPGARQSRIVLEPVDGWDGEALDLALKPDC